MFTKNLKLVLSTYKICEKFYFKSYNIIFYEIVFILSLKYVSKSVNNSLGKEINLSEVPEWKDIEKEVRIENVEKPLFAYYKPPTANNVDAKSPLGISVLINSKLKLMVSLSSAMLKPLIGFDTKRSEFFSNSE